ncbi:acid protease [Trichodelitschia bisporula]|uniref:Acid protease n=1 Tax=Trichodelitschia bisporula TaxID=703511 RepID=A0A6G1I414_9PEZI|nr:acid protease [Trichodelitschia bisporula]
MSYFRYLISLAPTASFAFLAIFAIHVRCVESATPPPSPLSCPPDQWWDGNDGPWSTFGMQIGTPPASLRLLPANGQGAVWVIVPEGCTKDDPTDCPNSRGNLFKRDTSSTWVQSDLYQLSVIEEKILGYNNSLNGIFGTDTVTIGWKGDGGPTVENAVLGGLATKAFYLGAFPLNPWPVNFTDIQNNKPSLLSTLKNQTKIPSLSWGYTAGMYNRAPKSFGSLTLGGIDVSRFEPNKLNFSMAVDISRDLEVAIQSITTSASSTPLLPKPIISFIDTVVPFIWLPLEACKQFESVFGLTWNAASELYLVDDTLHQKLLAQNPSITFRIGPQATGDAVDIKMSYGSFDLLASPPLVANQTRYFPLKRAVNDTQYALGRTFLQNAYVAANYEYFNFSISQATYPDTSVPQRLIALPARGASSASSSSGLSTGAIVGITVGGAAAILILVFALWLFMKNRKKPKSPTSPSYYPAEYQDSVLKAELGDTQIAEAGGGPVAHEIGAGYKPPVRYAPNEVFELPSQGLPVEAPTPEHSVYTTPYTTPGTTPSPYPPSRRPYPPRRPAGE